MTLPVSLSSLEALDGCDFRHTPLPFDPIVHRFALVPDRPSRPDRQHGVMSGRFEPRTFAIRARA